MATNRPILIELLAELGPMTKQIETSRPDEIVIDNKAIPVTYNVEDASGTEYAAIEALLPEGWVVRIDGADTDIDTFGELCEVCLPL